MVPKTYRADLVIVGGDITGKAMIPVISKGDGTFEAYFLGEKVSVSSQERLNSLKERIRAIGFYPYVTDEKGAQELRDNPKAVEMVFEELVKESLKSWVEMAERFLKDYVETRFLVMPGNDDPYVVDEILSTSKCLVNPDGKIIEVCPGYRLLSLGLSNITPWRCPRDLSEEEIWARIERILKDDFGGGLIFNIHVPPYGTHIDLAPKLDENMKPVLKPGGEYEMVHVGSISVRKAIEVFKPKLSFHGHIHESRGVDKVGGTLVFNPGSEYNTGVLRGVLVELDEIKVRDYIFTQG